MICQLIVLGFILFLAFWWASQGAFNAFVQLVAVILAGAFTFAFWEMLVMGFLIDRMPLYAWGVGFLSIFVLAFLIVRKILDLTVKKNLYFGQIPNLIGGGIFGFVLGILISGMTLLGIGFLPLELDLMGYQPLAVDDKTGQPVRKDSLWIPADEYAARFFTHLSGQTFYSGEPLAVYRPDLYMQSHISRLKDDANSSPVTNPASVEIVDVALPGGPVTIPALEIPLLFGDSRKVEGRVCCVQTKWVSKPPGTYDGDGLVRIYPSQVRLGVTNGVDDESRALAPLAFSVIDPLKPRAGRVFVPFLKDNVQAANSGDSEFVFIFVVPDNYTPRYISFRGTRFVLPAPEAFKSDAKSFYDLKGTYPPPPLVVATAAPAPGAAPAVGNRTDSSALIGGLEVNANLHRPIDRNMVRGEFTYSGDDILNGNSIVAKPFEGRIDKKVRTERLAQPAGTVILRGQFDPGRTSSFLGSAVAAAAAVQAIYLTDSNGTQYLPIGYVWFKSTAEETQIKIDRSDLIRSAKEIPFREVNPGIDFLYLYWQVPKGARITQLHIGQKTTIEMDVKTQ